MSVKSTLLNRLAGSGFRLWKTCRERPADRVFTRCHLERRSFTLVDTGGLGTGMETEIDRGVKEQISQAMSEADAIVFMVDREGPASCRLMRKLPTLCGG